MADGSINLKGFLIVQQDPKDTLLNILKGITTTIDDNITATTIISLYAEGPENLRSLFNTYDVIITLNDPRTRPERHIQDVPTYYPSTIPVSVISIDKYSSGVLIATGTKMQWKMRVAIRAIIEANAQVGAYTLRIIDEAPNDRWIAGLQVFENIYSVLYKTG